MPKFFIKNEQINDNRIVISGEDVNHIANVLRMKIDDELQICDIDTSDNYVANISEIGKDKIMCSICKKIKSEAESDINLTIFQGIPKSDKMELIIQKSTELGVKEIIPVAMERCVSKISGKDEIKKIERWQKISEEVITYNFLDRLAQYCDEFLVHAADVEGRGGGIDRDLVGLLASYKKVPITYAGGVSEYGDIELISYLSDNNMDFTVGSCLDLFGGHLSYDRIVKRIVNR